MMMFKTFITTGICPRVMTRNNRSLSRSYSGGFCLRGRQAMRKRGAAFLAAVCLALTACSLSDSSSQTVQDIMSGVNEKNGGENDSSAALPEAVSLDSERMTELTADSGGIIECEQMGVRVRLPSQFKAYFYGIGEVDPKEYGKTVNPSCTHSLFLVSPYFPQVCEYVRISTDRNIAAEVLPIEQARKNEPRLTQEEYIRRVKSDLVLYSERFIAYENADLYNYTGGGKNEGYAQGFSTDIGAGYNMVMFTELKSPRTQAPNSEISDISCKQTELDNGAFGLRLDYTLKRNGVSAKKEVYWLAAPGQTLMRRVELTTDPGGKASFDTKSFLEGIELMPPKLPESDLMYGYEQMWQEET